MLKKRFILCLTLNDGVLFRTKLFKPDYRYTLNFVDITLADELVLLDVTRNPESRDNFWTTVREFSRNVFLPLTIGGFIRTMDDVKQAFDEGADKIVINTQAYRRPQFITEVAEKYGNQAVVGSIDVRDGIAWVAQGSMSTDRVAKDWALEATALGAGELLVMDISRDGSLQGYNLALIRDISEAVSVPLVAVGGLGTWQHAVDAFKAGADAVATQCIFHFTEPSIRAAKSYLAERGVEMRL